ncbi:MAG TPA: hypothetical protein VIF57_14315 [Polyangia bacterium]
MGIDKVASATRWARAHVPELCVFVLGILLRLSMALTYDARTGWDFNAHWPHIMYIVQRHELPPLVYNTTACHPPLYHLIGAALVTLGLSSGALGWLSALWGMLRLALIWWGLERWLPASRLARVVALALAAVIPASVHLEGMITNEVLVMVLSAGALVAVPWAIAAARVGRVGPMVALALLVALAMMAKISASVLVTSVAAAVALEIVRARPSWWPALRARALPLIAGAVVLASITGPFFVRNQILYGQTAPSAYEGYLRLNQAPFKAIPYFQRRPLAFYLGWNLGIYSHPVTPTGLKPEPRFFPVLIATTFNDYYVFSYSGGARFYGRRWISPAAMTLGSLSVAGGTIIALVTVLAWFGAVRALWRRKEDGEPDPRFALLLAPLGALIGQLHFAIKYPNDNFGPIKGAYLQFIAPVLCALFGVGVAWMWRRARGRWLWRGAALIAMGAVALVAVYSVHARFPRFGKDANRQGPFFFEPAAAKWK